MLYIFPSSAVLFYHNKNRCKQSNLSFVKKNKKKQQHLQINLLLLHMSFLDSTDIYRVCKKCSGQINRCCSRGKRSFPTCFLAQFRRHKACPSRSHEIPPLCREREKSAIQENNRKSKKKKKYECM